MKLEGSKRVEVAGEDYKKQITAVLGGSSVGDFLPPQIIYRGTSTDVLPSKNQVLCEYCTLVSKLKHC